jgi:tetratricopeptide (TPR) repeat protein
MKSNSMKRILYLVILFVLPIFSFAKDDAGELFKEGNNFYTKGNYKDALKTYQQILDEGYQSAAVYFNMGNASYKLGEIPSAILYYEKAHKLAPGDDDINFNIRFANLKTTDKIDEIPEFFLSSWWRKFILGLSLSTLSVLSVVFVIAASVILILYFFSNSVSVKKLSFYASVTLFSLGLLTLFVSGRQASYFDDHKQAIIFNPAVSVKNGPLDNSGTLFILHEGTRVDVLENDGSWTKIRLANGNQGWIKGNDVKEI